MWASFIGMACDKHRILVLQGLIWEFCHEFSEVYYVAQPHVKGHVGEPLDM